MTPCIESPLPKDKDGYPRIKWNSRQTPASRVLWQIMFGSIPDGMLICHHCDNPACVNPEHLYLGTFEDNMADKVKRLRVAGERNPRYKITSEDVQAMKDLYNNGMSQEAIGKLMGFSQSQVSTRMRDER